ncbi:hypothetical protein UFOVP733_17 [uncultured Caudovirales phage]|uniref:Uncharacterized protein n=1 Tax=uncultured Caudovirales phage TaxID=2100421 RepID=A0A6J7X689_9CAUD|nr:hypothetical protein UFOVP733_17 [uncultured Caudovirales phage]CAB5224937.1 hypothetical protein UFOVP743_42 [uncultured Caudovirales phage]
MKCDECGNKKNEGGLIFSKSNPNKFICGACQYSKNKKEKYNNRFFDRSHRIFLSDEEKICFDIYQAAMDGLFINKEVLKEILIKLFNATMCDRQHVPKNLMYQFEKFEKCEKLEKENDYLKKSIAGLMDERVSVMMGDKRLREENEELKKKLNSANNTIFYEFEKYRTICDVKESMESDNHKLKEEIERLRENQEKNVRDLKIELGQENEKPWCEHIILGEPYVVFRKNKELKISCLLFDYDCERCKDNLGIE